jgi:U3 small nucleolar RNA-associated protein 10
VTREATKALEWLIRRFRIHVFPQNSEALLFNFLPYHAQPVYQRLLEIVSLPSKFAFLSQYNNIRTAANLAPVPRQLLIRTLSSDAVFMETYFEFVVSRVKSGYGYPLMIHTWSTLTVETILQMRQARVNDEIIVSRIMPFVAMGLQMNQNLEFQIASYMILTILASNRTLTDTVLDAAMDAVCQGWDENCRRYAIMCLVTLAQRREGENVLTDTVVKSLLLLTYVPIIVELNPVIYLRKLIPCRRNYPFQNWWFPWLPKSSDPQIYLYLMSTNCPACCFPVGLTPLTDD